MASHHVRPWPALLALCLLAATGCASAADLAERPPSKAPYACLDEGAGQCPPTIAPSGAPTWTSPDAVPEVGQCRQLPASALLARSTYSPALDCGHPHNLETAAVIDVPGVLTHRRVRSSVSECQAAVRAYTGVGATESRLTLHRFLPTLRQRREGQSWVRCDIGLQLSTGEESLADRVGSLRGVAVGRLPVWLRACTDAPPGPLSQPLVGCESRHGAELLPVPIALATAQPYHRSGLTELAEQRCTAVRRAVFPQHAASSVVLPSRREWRTGLVEAQCWVYAVGSRQLPAR